MTPKLILITLLLSLTPFLLPNTLSAQEDTSDIDPNAPVEICSQQEAETGGPPESCSVGTGNETLSGHTFLRHVGFDEDNNYLCQKSLCLKDDERPYEFVCREDPTDIRFDDQGNQLPPRSEADTGRPQDCLTSDNQKGVNFSRFTLRRQDNQNYCFRTQCIDYDDYLRDAGIDTQTTGDIRSDLPSNEEIQPKLHIDYTLPKVFESQISSKTGDYIKSYVEALKQALQELGEKAFGRIAIYAHRACQVKDSETPKQLTCEDSNPIVKILRGTSNRAGMYRRELPPLNPPLNANPLKIGPFSLGEQTKEVNRAEQEWEKSIYPEFYKPVTKDNNPNL